MAVGDPSRVKAVILHPARLVPLSFLGFILIGTLALMTPGAHRSGDADFMASAFTTVSATCVTGLATVDTATYWTPLGQGIILAEIQVGGFGIMTLATMLSLLVRGRLGTNSRLLAQSETKTLALGDVGAVLKRILVAVVIAESVVAVLLTLRFLTTYDDGNLRSAIWHGVFHSISAFNNAGFALYSNNLVGFVADAWICWPICAAIIAGGIGFPVAFELLRALRRPSTWSAHTRITVYGYTALLVAGIVLFIAFEWSNPGTLGPLSAWDKTVAGVTQGVVPRTAGFNSIDYGAIRPETLLITLVLMFVGGGSAGTAGGVKVTTFFLLGHVILTEVMGEDDVRVGNRRIGDATIRQAVTVALLGVGVVTLGSIGMVMLTDFPMDKAVFEVVSAFGTVGLSTGITPQLSVPAQLLIMATMFIGRVGSVTVASALALHANKRKYHLPEEHPIVG